MGNLNPYYNESFVFLVEQEQLRVKKHTVAFIIPLQSQNNAAKKKKKVCESERSGCKRNALRKL